MSRPIIKVFKAATKLEIELLAHLPHFAISVAKNTGKAGISSVWVFIMLHMQLARERLQILEDSEAFQEYLEALNELFPEGESQSKETAIRDTEAIFNRIESYLEDKFGSMME